MIIKETKIHIYNTYIIHIFRRQGETPKITFFPLILALLGRVASGPGFSGRAKFGLRSDSRHEAPLRFRFRKRPANPLHQRVRVIAS